MKKMFEGQGHSDLNHIDSGKRIKKDCIHIYKLCRIAIILITVRYIGNMV